MISAGKRWRLYRADASSVADRLHARSHQPVSDILPAALKQHGGAIRQYALGVPVPLQLPVLSRSAIAPPNRSANRDWLQRSRLFAEADKDDTALVAHRNREAQRLCRSTSPSTTGRLPGTLVSASPRISPKRLRDRRERRNHSRFMGLHQRLYRADMVIEGLGGRMH